MGGVARAGAAISIVIAAMLSVLAGAAAGASCEDKILTDWSDNGRVDRIYALHCYEAALDSMPTDLRDYTNAPDAIERALAAAATKSAPKTARGERVAAGAGAQVAAAPSGIPLPLVALTAVSLAVFAAGGLGYLVRRRREHQT
jgi:hypothetical protein